jgi:hypothetical protein
MLAPGLPERHSMRTTTIAAILFAAALATVAVVLFVKEREAPGRIEPGPPALVPDDQKIEIQRLSDEVGRLAAEVRRLSRERPPAPIVPRPSSPLPETRLERAPGEAMPLPARWYLDQYVLSFEGGGSGSEYFRLAVDAYARELVDPIIDLVLDAGRPVPLRRNLVAILGTPRFSGHSAIIEALVLVIQSGDPREVALIALKVLPAVGGPGTVATLERIVWSVASEELSVAVLRAIAHLAGKDLNAVLLRILVSAPASQVEALRILISLLNGSDDASALQCFMRASRLGQPVRLVAANRIADFTDAPFKDYVTEWLGFETDPQVRAALERASKQQGAGKSWGAARAIGPPDANPDNDDPNAWASAKPDGGVEWLELGYATALAASSVRIYEVNARGAVAELRAKDASGTWHQLWAGTTGQVAGPLTIEFPTTTFAISALRVILDTTRSPGWNEIDAVEIVGPQGRAWASDARASSSYGN